MCVCVCVCVCVCALWTSGALDLKKVGNWIKFCSQLWRQDHDNQTKGQKKKRHGKKGDNREEAFMPTKFSEFLLCVGMCVQQVSAGQHETWTAASW